MKGIVRREVPMRTRTSVMLAPSSTQFGVLHTVLETFRNRNKRTLEEKEQRASKASRSGTTAPHSRSRVSAPERAARAPPSSSDARRSAAPPGAASGAAKGSGSRAPSAYKDLKPNMPILVVPSAITALVGIMNVQPLLAHSEYSTGAERKAAGVAKEPSFVLAHRFEDGSSCELFITDNPTKLTSAEWSQVAACVAQGSTWQFKGWPFAHGEVEIFQKMCGFYFRHSDEPPNQKTKGWTVTNLVFSREKSRKHEVGVMVSLFWTTLHKWLQLHKPHLLLSARHAKS